ncbi:cytochrome b/b6 domain-containing protein, partial [bacterium]|nr:cytochrome b/b6 domain-containing protein [bacterium]
YLMGWIRFIHFVFAYAFAVSVITRMIWTFRGNCFAGWREYFPFFGAEGREEMKEVFAYYTFRSKHPPETTGHNPMAATAYFVLFLFYWFMILTGFAMYAEHVINHVYSAWLMDIKEKGGEISSMFSGYKFTTEERAVCKSRHWNFFPRKSKKLENRV